MIGEQRSQPSSGQQSSGLHLWKASENQHWRRFAKCSGCPQRYVPVLVQSKKELKCACDFQDPCSLGITEYNKLKQKCFGCLIWHVTLSCRVRKGSHQWLLAAQIGVSPDRGAGVFQFLFSITWKLMRLLWLKKQLHMCKVNPESCHYWCEPTLTSFTNSLYEKNLWMSPCICSRKFCEFLFVIFVDLRATSLLVHSKGRWFQRLV